MTTDQFDESTGLLLQVSLPAMATDFEVLLRKDADREATEQTLEALRWIEDFEKKLSIYLPLSDVSRVNSFGYESGVKVDSDVIEVLKLSLAFSERTHGAFDVTAGPLVDAWGFTQRRGRKPSSDQIADALSRVGYQGIRIDELNRTVGFESAGMSLNFGAIGKGFALDKAAMMLRSAGIENFLIHGGQSTILAYGSRRDGERGWPIALLHPTRPDRRLGRFWLVDEALSTSGSGKQFFHHQGKRMGHVIDPRTGQPSGDMLSLTVVASSGAKTDALATGLFVEGSAAAQATAERDGDLGIVSVSEGSSVKLEVCASGLPANRWEPFEEG